MKTRWKIYLLLLITLGLGAALGILSTHFCHKSGVGGIYKCRSHHGGESSYHSKCPHISDQHATTQGSSDGHHKSSACLKKDSADCENKCPHHSKKNKKGRGHPGMKDISAEHILAKMKDHLSLSLEQIQQIEPKLASYSERINQNLKANREAMVGIMDEMERELVPILSKEQMNKFKKKMDEKRSFMDRPRPE